jgi:hypothetical protein
VFTVVALLAVHTVTAQEVMPVPGPGASQPLVLKENKGGEAVLFPGKDGGQPMVVFWKDRGPTAGAEPTLPTSLTAGQSVLVSATKGTWPLAGTPVSGVHATPVGHGGMPMSSVNLHGNCGPLCGPCPDECCDRGPMLSIFGEYLYLTVRDVDVVFAQAVDGCTATAIPTGPLGVVDPDYEPAFRAGFGVFLTPRSSIQATYTYFHSATDARVEAPAGTVLRSLLTHPGTLNCAAGSQAAAAGYDINFDLIDLDYLHVLCDSCDFTLRGLVGVRYARLEQQLFSEFSIVGLTNVVTDIDFEGVGPRVGLDGEYRLCKGFYSYGRGVASFVIGEFEADYVQSSEFTGVLAATSYETERLVPILELELGLGWSSPGGCLRLQGGYYIAAWFNTITTPGLIEAVRVNNFSGTGDNLRDHIIFDGLTARAEVRF